MYRHASPAIHLLILVLLVILLGTCASSIYFTDDETNRTAIEVIVPVTSFTPAVVLTPTATLTATPSFTPPPTLDTAPDTSPDWSLLQPGLERRMIQIYDDQNQQVEAVHIWRLDQKYFRMDVAYEEKPKSLEAWQAETNALMVVNGGFYSVEDERYFPDGLTIVDGKASGHSFNGFGGMLAIADSRAELRWLAQEPYNSSEPLQAALQSFPILVEPGGQLGFGAEKENNVSARRTVIGQDRQGRILFIVTPQGHFTLHQLSAYLTESDLDLDIAVNLDGGGSTGILVASPYEIIPPNRPIPFVILVYAR